MKNICLSILIVYIVGCSNPNKNISNSEIEFTDRLISYNCKISNNYIPNKWDTLISSIELIPLETNNKSLISHIDHVIVNDKDLFIQDGKMKVLQFSLNGDFIRQIGKRGRAPGEYIDLIDFQIFDNQIAILDSKKIILFNAPSGNYIKNITWNKKEADYVYPSRLGFFSENNYYLWASSFNGVPNNKECRLLHHIKNGELTESFLSSDYSGYSNHRFYLLNDSSYLIRPTTYRNESYILTSDSILPYSHINFGKHEVQLKKLSKGYSSETLHTNRDLFKRNRWTCTRYYYAENNKYIFSSYLDPYNKDNGISSFIINKQNNTNFIVRSFKIEGVLEINMIGTLSDNRFIAIIKPYDIISALKEHSRTIEESQLLRNLIDKFKEVKIDDNPLVCFIEVA